jgi:hypothetical protein
MALFTVSDIVIAITLVINAVALISSKIQNREGQPKPSDNESESEDGGNDCASNIVDHVFMSSHEKDSQPLLGPGSHWEIKQRESDKSSASGGGMVARLRALVSHIRKYSCIIVMWNALFMVLMVFVFGA